MKIKLLIIIAANLVVKQSDITNTNYCQDCILVSHTDSSTCTVYRLLSTRGANTSFAYECEVISTDSIIQTPETAGGEYCYDSSHHRILVRLG